MNISQETSSKRYARSQAEDIISDLQERSIKELDALFSEGSVPAFREIKGETAGAFLIWSSHVSWIVLGVIKLFFESPIARWTGKEFIHPFHKGQKGYGSNLFQNRIFPKRYKFDTYIKNAYQDGKACLALDYRNYPSLMFGLVDDVRRIREGVVLGQMYFQFPWKKERVFIGYFTLCAIED